MAASNAPVFPFPGGQAGAEPGDPQTGKPGHFAWSRWIKQFCKNLNAKTMSLEDRVVAVEGKIPAPEQNLGTALQRITTLEGQVGTQAQRITTLEGEVNTLKSLTSSQTFEIDSLKSRMTTAEGYLTTLEQRLTFHVNKPGHGGGT